MSTTPQLGKTQGGTATSKQRKKRTTREKNMQIHY